MGSLMSINQTTTLWVHGLLTSAPSAVYLTTYLSRYPISDSHVVWINALSGAVDVVSKDLDGAVTSTALLAPDIQEQLRARGYVYTSRDEELEMLRSVYHRLAYRSDELPVSFVICPTYQCNFRCPYCYEGQLTRTTAVMNQTQMEQMFAAMDTIRTEYAKSPVELELFGGEPLQPATEHIVDQVLAYASSRGYPCGIVTNGGNIRHFAPTLHRYRKVISSVSVTIDGSPEIHNRRRVPLGGGDSFTPIAQGIDILQWMRIPVTVQINVDKQNIDCVPWLVSFMNERGWTKRTDFHFVIQPIDDRTMKGNTPHALSEQQLIQRLQEY